MMTTGQLLFIVEIEDEGVFVVEVLYSGAFVEKVQRVSLLLGAPSWLAQVDHIDLVHLKMERQ